jgi:hypothetical protein
VLPSYNQSFYIQPQTYSNIESGIPLRSFVVQEIYQSVRSKGLARRESWVDPRMTRFCFCMGYAILGAHSQTDGGRRQIIRMCPLKGGFYFVDLCYIFLLTEFLFLTCLPNYIVIMIFICVWNENFWNDEERENITWWVPLDWFSSGDQIY